MGYSFALPSVGIYNDDFQTGNFLAGNNMTMMPLAGNNIGMNPSLFSGGMDMSTLGAGMYGSGMGMSGGMDMYTFGAGMYGYGMSRADMERLMSMSPEERQAEMDRLSDQRMDAQMRRQERLADRQYELERRLRDKNQQRSVDEQQRQNSINAPTDAAINAALKIKTLITTNRKDEILAAWTEFEQAVAKLPQFQKLANGASVTNPMNPQEIKAAARTFYAQHMGSDVIQDINTNLAGSFGQGMKKGLSLGLAGDDMDADMLTEKILGLQRDSSNKVARVGGNVAGGAVVGAAIGTWIAPGPGTLIGGIIGGVVGGISSFWS